MAAGTSARGGYNVEVGMDLGLFDRGIQALRGGAGSVRGALGGFKNAIGGVANSIFNLKNLIIGGLVAGAFYKLKQAIGEFTAVSSRAQETQSKFDVVFKHLAKEANAWADTTAKATKRSRTDIRGWMATLQDTFVPLGMTRQEAMSLSEQITQLGIDLGSFSNIDTADVMRDLTSAIVGNHETVRKFGIIIDEARLKSAAYAAGIANAGEELDAMQKVQARVKIIMASSTDAQGDAVRTADQWANSTRGLSAGWEDFKKRLGDFITQSPAAGRLISMLGDKLGELEQWVDKNSGAVTAFVEGAITKASETLKGWADDIQTFIAQGGLKVWLAEVEVRFLTLKKAIISLRGAWDLLRAGIAKGAANVPNPAEGLARIELKNAREEFAAAKERLKEARLKHSYFGPGEGGAVAAEMKRAEDAFVLAHAMVGAAAKKWLFFQRQKEELGNLGQKWYDMALDAGKEIAAAEERIEKIRREAGKPIKWGLGKGDYFDPEAERERMHAEEMAKANEEKMQALNSAKRMVDQLGKYVEKGFEKETDKLRSELDKQLDARRDAVNKIKEIQRDALSAEMDWQERKFALTTGKQKGQQRYAGEFGMVGLYNQQAVHASMAGQFEDERKWIEKAQDHAERAFEEATNKSQKRSAAREMQRLQKMKMASFGAQEGTERQKAAKASDLVADLNLKMDELYAKVEQKLEIASNFPELSSQLDAIKAKLAELDGKTVEIHAKYVEEHAAGGWAGGGIGGRDSVHALLTPGEFVVNARSAQMNKALLERINAGFAVPARFARGGSVPGSVAAARESGTTVNVTFNGPGDREYVRNVVIPGIEQAVRRGRAGRRIAQ